MSTGQEKLSLLGQEYLANVPDDGIKLWDLMVNMGLHRANPYEEDMRYLVEKGLVKTIRRDGELFYYPTDEGQKLKSGIDLAEIKATRRQRLDEIADRIEKIIRS